MAGPPALAEALSSLGRTRNSSATPVQAIVSPQPGRDYQAAISSFHQLSLDEGPTSTRPDTPFVGASRTSGHQGSSFGDHQRESGSSQQHRGFPNLAQGFPSTSQGFGTWNQGVQSQWPPGTFNPPSTTRQGTMQSLSMTAPNQSSSQFSSFSRETSGQDMSTRETQRDSTQVASSSQLQARLNDLQKMVNRMPTIPRAVQDHMCQELREIGQQYDDRQQYLSQEANRTRGERDNFQAQLEKVQEQLQEVSNQRDQGYQQRDNLRKQLSGLELKHKQSTDRMRQLLQDRQKQTEDLEKRLQDKAAQLRARGEQFSEKQPIRKQTNLSSFSHRAIQAGMRDPFSTPLANQGSRRGVMSQSPSPPMPSTKESAHAYSQPPTQRPVPTGPANPHVIQRRPNLPFGRAQYQPEFSYDTSRLGSRTTHMTTEPGETASKALVLHNSDQELAENYTNAITKVYGMIEGWVRTYAGTPNPTQDRHVSSTNQKLWDYMLKLTYASPGQRQDAHNHVIALLSTTENRHWFMMRMILQYVVKDVVDVDAFKTYSPEVRGIIEYVKEKLKERGLNNASRQVLIDQQSAAIQSVVAASNYSEYRSTQLALHSKKLRDMLGPMLNIGVSRGDAGRDLGALVIYAWDLSAKMYTSRMSFQIYFPETSARFAASTMISKDKPPRDPHQLQIAQARLKLVITPIITMRNDTSDTITAKNLHRANVLVSQ